MITATLYGRLTREPEHVTPRNGGDAYVRFSMACDNGKDRAATFVNVSVFGRRGDVIMQYFTKGNRIVAHVQNLEVSGYIDGNGVNECGAVSRGICRNTRRSGRSGTGVSAAADRDSTDIHAACSGIYSASGTVSAACRSAANPAPRHAAGSGRCSVVKINDCPAGLSANAD